MDNVSDHDLLIRLDAKVDAFLKSQADHEGRIRLVEADREQFQGALRTLRGLIALFGTIASLSLAMSAWLALFKH